jgi:hypothetical protein
MEPVEGGMEHRIQDHRIQDHRIRVLRWLIQSVRTTQCAFFLVWAVETRSYSKCRQIFSKYTDH